MLVGLGGVDGRDLAGLLVLDALVDEQGGVTAVVEDHVRAAGGGVRPGQRLLRAPPVLLQGLALPGEDRDALGVVGRAVRADGDGGGRVVLGGEDVAGGPADLGAQGDQGLDQDGGLHGHVQRAGDAGAGQRLRRGVLLADRHQAGHLVLGEGDLLAAEVGQGEVGDLEVLSVVDSGHTSCSSGWGEVGLGWSARRRAQDVRRRGTRMPGALRSAVRRRPSLPRPVRGTGPPDRHQQRRLARSRIYTDRPSGPQSASGQISTGGSRSGRSAGPGCRDLRALGQIRGLLNFCSCAGVVLQDAGDRRPSCASSADAIPHDKGVRRST